MPDDPMFRLAVSKTYHAFKIPSLVKMIHLNDIFQEDLDIWSKSPGLPWKDIGYRTKGDIKKDPEAVRKVRHFWHRIKAGEKLYPPDSLAYVRSHVCEVGESKVRAVWGYPATMTFGEAVFALPLIRAYQDRTGPMAYGYETALGGMKRIYNRYCQYRHYAAVDFKKFDKTVPAWLIDIAFEVLRSNIDFTRYRDHGIADARRMMTMYEYIESYFINTTIRLADGSRYRKTSGIASGSYFTQLVGSVINYLLLQWASLTQFGDYLEDIMVLGDDSLSATRSDLSLRECAELFSTVGMEVNMTKSQITRELSTIQFLGYKIGNGVPSKDRDAWMTALLYPERPDRSFDELQSRALGLYYANMCVDANFAALCARIVKFRKFDLILSRNFERHLKFIGVSLDVLRTGELPTEIEFARLML
jgi:hypothetical protein